MTNIVNFKVISHIIGIDIAVTIMALNSSCDTNTSYEISWVSCKHVCAPCPRLSGGDFNYAASEPVDEAMHALCFANWSLYFSIDNQSTW